MEPCLIGPDTWLVQLQFLDMILSWLLWIPSNNDCSWDIMLDWEMQHSILCNKKGHSPCTGAYQLHSSPTFHMDALWLVPMNGARPISHPNTHSLGWVTPLHHSPHPWEYISCPVVWEDSLPVSSLHPWIGLRPCCKYNNYNPLITVNDTWREAAPKYPHFPKKNLLYLHDWMPIVPFVPYFNVKDSRVSFGDACHASCLIPQL